MENIFFWNSWNKNNRYLYLFLLFLFTSGLLMIILCSSIGIDGVVDLNVKYATTADSFAYLKVDNILDNEYVVAYRPYGARPGKDRMFQIGYRQGF